ncbi:MAG TPA: hypothetical protein ENJ35_05545 [Gammaproteobacteria bacterium]|nr:hypothetical protein [Gammaproteobacteria bacterium]
MSLKPWRETAPHKDVLAGTFKQNDLSEAAAGELLIRMQDKGGPLLPLPPLRTRKVRRGYPGIQ